MCASVTSQGVANGTFTSHFLEDRVCGKRRGMGRLCQIKHLHQHEAFLLAQGGNASRTSRVKINNTFLKFLPKPLGSRESPFSAVVITTFN